jgi:hypothetical protein
MQVPQPPAILLPAPPPRTFNASTSPCTRLAARTRAAARGSDHIAMSIRAVVSIPGLCLHSTVSLAAFWIT